MNAPLTVSPIKLLMIAALLALSGVAARGQVMITYAENPNDYNSRLTGTSVYRFNDLAVGNNTNVVWSGVGTIDQINIKGADYYGGAVDNPVSNPSRYALQSVASGITSSTLTFNTSSAYFGLWWSAGDVNNTLRFYNGATLIAEFKTSTLLDVIAGDSSYKGNPANRTQNSSQSYAFLNFFAMEGATWDRVVLSNTVSGTAFEADNYTSRVAAYDPTTDGPMPGKQLVYVNGTTTVLVPEPGSMLLGMLAIPLLLLRRKRAA